MPKHDRVTTTVSTKGQVILPKVVREQRRWSAGTRLIVESTDEGVLLRSLPAFAPTRLGDVFGCLPPVGPSKTLDEMDAAVAAEIRRRHAGG